LRRDYFDNRVFFSLSAATCQAENGLTDFKDNQEANKRVVKRNWISVILNVN
jgi:hypothetical protein